MKRVQLNRSSSGALAAFALALLIVAAVGCEQAGVGAELPPTAIDTTVAATAPPPATADAKTPAPTATTVIPTATVIDYAGGGLVTVTPGYSTPTPVPSPVATDIPNPLHTPTPVATAVPVPTLPVPTPVPPATATPTPEPTATATLGPPTPTPIIPLPRTAQFVPLDNPVFVSAANAPSRVTDGSFVLGLEWKGEVHAYPLDMMWWHHIVNDTIGGDPVLVTY